MLVLIYPTGSLSFLPLSVLWLTLFSRLFVSSFLQRVLSMWRESSVSISLVTNVKLNSILLKSIFVSCPCKASVPVHCIHTFTVPLLIWLIPGGRFMLLNPTMQHSPCYKLHLSVRTKESTVISDFLQRWSILILHFSASAALRPLEDKHCDMKLEAWVFCVHMKSHQTIFPHQKSSAAFSLKSLVVLSPRAACWFNLMLIWEVSL